MALNFPTSPTDLQLYTDSNSVVWQYNASKGVWDKYPSKVVREFSGAKLILSNDKGLTANLLPIEFDDSEYDTEEYFNINQYPSRINIKRTGYYRLNFQIATSNQGTGASYQFSIKKNNTITLSNAIAGPNQFLYYDEISLLYAGDYIEILGLDTNTVGELTTNSFFEIERVGFGMGVSTAFNAFSGVNVKLTSDKSLTSTPTSIEWDTTIININADVDGNVYWSLNDKENILIYTNGYYRVKGMLVSSNSGGTNSYQLSLRAAGSVLETATISANERLDIDEIYYFTSGSIIDIQASNSGAVGSIKQDSFLQIIRQGI